MFRFLGFRTSRKAEARTVYDNSILDAFKERLRKDCIFLFRNAIWRLKPRLFRIDKILSIGFLKKSEKTGLRLSSIIASIVSRDAVVLVVVQKAEQHRRSRTLLQSRELSGQKVYLRPRHINCGYAAC